MNARYVDPQIIFSMSLKKKFDVQPVTQRCCMKGWVAFTGLSSGTFVFCVTNFVVSGCLDTSIGTQCFHRDSASILRFSVLHCISDMPLSAVLLFFFYLSENENYQRKSALLTSHDCMFAFLC